MIRSYKQIFKRLMHFHNMVHRALTWNQNLWSMDHEFHYFAQDPHAQYNNVPSVLPMYSGIWQFLNIKDHIFYNFGRGFHAQYNYTARFYARCECLMIILISEVSHLTPKAPKLIVFVPLAQMMIQSILIKINHAVFKEVKRWPMMIDRHRGQ